MSSARSHSRTTRSIIQLILGLALMFSLVVPSKAVTVDIDKAMPKIAAEGVGDEPQSEISLTILESDKALPKLLTDKSLPKLIDGGLGEDIQFEEETISIVSDKALPKLSQDPITDDADPMLGKVPPPRGGVPIWIPISHTGSEDPTDSVADTLLSDDTVRIISDKSTPKLLGVSISGVPEPNTILLAMSATALLAMQRRYR